jgi:hypothetical protein
MVKIDTTTQPLKLTVSQEGVAIIDDDGRQVNFWTRLEVPFILIPEQDEDTEIGAIAASIDQLHDQLSNLVLELNAKHQQKLEFVPIYDEPEETEVTW